jgi:hypothetical protein
MIGEILWVLFFGAWPAEIEFGAAAFGRLSGTGEALHQASAATRQPPYPMQATAIPRSISGSMNLDPQRIDKDIQMLS